MLIRRLLIVGIFMSQQALFAADTALVLDTAERHLKMQIQNLPGKVSISLGQFDATRLPPCSAMEAFTPPGSRPTGRTNVGVRCLSPNIWTVLVPAQIAVTGNYVSSSRALVAGQTIQAGDLVTLSGDISTQPAGVISNPTIAIGKTLRNSIGPGQTIRADQLLAPLVIRQGQTVRVISVGDGFSVSAEGKAINNAALGELAQVRMNSGQTISGVARADGAVEVSF